MNVFIIAATSVDGFIAEKTDQTSTDWTSKEDKHFFVERTKQAKVIVCGATTFKTIGRALPERLNIVYSNNPDQFREMTQKYDDSQLRIIHSGPRELVKQLEAEGFSELAVCGGAAIYSLFMSAGVVNKLYLTIEPVIFGKGVKLFGEEIQTKLRLVAQTNLSEQTILLEYDVTA